MYEDYVRWPALEIIPWREHVRWHVLLWQNHTPFVEQPIGMQLYDEHIFFFATNTVFATMCQNNQFLFWHVAYKQKDSSDTSTSLWKTSYKMKIPRPIETQMTEQKCSLFWHYFPWLCLLPVAISGPDMWTVLVEKKLLHRDSTQAISTLLSIILGYVIQFYSTL